jgi:hypothetical protein
MAERKEQKRSSRPPGVVVVFLLRYSHDNDLTSKNFHPSANYNWVNFVKIDHSAGALKKAFRATLKHFTKPGCHVSPNPHLHRTPETDSR